MFPKKAFITFATENYSTLVDKLIQSILLFSNYPIIVYGYNFDYKFDNPRVFSKRLDDANLNLPEFEKSSDISGHIGIVNRADKNTYYTLSRKPVVLLDSINNGVEEGVFLDADGLVRHNIDELFLFSSDCSNYPLIGKGLFEYMMLYGKGDPAVGNPLEFPMMNLLGIRERTLFYGQTNVIFFNKNCKEFFEECVTVANNKNIIRHNLLYAPYHDETIMNVLLWKRKANKQLPLVHFNLSDFNSLQKFEQSESGIYMDNCPWHQIPANKNDIKFFHGCKSIVELDKCLNYFSKDKSGLPFPKIFKSEKHKNSKKIAIVTLFDKNYEQLAKMSIPNKLDYANKHGYDFIYFDKVIDPSRPPQWSKVKAIEYALQDYDWVWWIDIDALIMEFDVKLESIIDENYDIIFTANKYSYLSNGSSFFKNSQVSRQFLKDCYELQIPYLKNINVQVFDHEQQSMRALVLNDPIYKQKTKLIDERVCNSYCTTTNAGVLGAYPNWNTESNLYQKGDFVIQFCGRTFDERLKIFDEYNKKVNKHSKNVVIIGSYANTQEKVNSLIRNINQFKKLGIDIVLISNYLDSMDIRNLVTHYIYDSENLLLSKDKSPVKWFADNKETIHIHHKGNSYMCCKHMYLGIDFCKSKYDNFIYVEYDSIISELDFPKLQDLFLKLNSHDAWICNFSANGEEFYDTNIFAGKVEFFSSKVNLAKSIEEWNNTPPYSYMNETLEKIFTVLLAGVKDKIYFTNLSANKYFSNSEINNFSAYSSANVAYNAEDKSLPIIFVITIDKKYTILVNDSVVYQKKHFNGDWIKYSVKISEKSTNIKVKCEDILLIDTNVDLSNVENLKEHCVRFKM
jgi:hypothetical protein